MLVGFQLLDVLERGGQLRNSRLLAGLVFASIGF